MAQRTVLMDTSFIVAIENADDPHHERARELDLELNEEGATNLLHWGIIFEIADGYARLSRRSKGGPAFSTFFSPLKSSSAVFASERANSIFDSTSRLGA
jgi:predicted nucleic acid-binding protein